MADHRIGRVNWTENGQNEFQKNVTISNQQKCFEFDASVKFDLAYIFRPIEFQLSFALTNQEMAQKQFCTDCVTIDPTKTNSAQASVIFNTGCAGIVCEPNLKLESRVVLNTPTFTLGSTKALTIIYKVSNSRESAYLSQLKVVVNEESSVDFSKIPSNCKQEEWTLLCDLIFGNAISSGQIVELPIDLDMSLAVGKQLAVHAEVFSSGKEVEPKDNKVMDEIRFVESSEVDINGYENR